MRKLMGKGIAKVGLGNLDVRRDSCYGAWGALDVTSLRSRGTAVEFGMQ